MSVVIHPKDLNQKSNKIELKAYLIYLLNINETKTS